MVMMMMTMMTMVMMIMLTARACGHAVGKQVGRLQENRIWVD
jgi:hypothetical protein